MGNLSTNDELQIELNADDLLQKGFDIADFVGDTKISKNLTLKSKILNSTILPPKNHKYAVKKFGNRLLKFQMSWIETFPWLAYSPKKDGVYCKNCLLFVKHGIGKGFHEQPGALVTTAFDDWKHAKERFQRHAVSQYHIKSTVDADYFLKVYN